MLLKKIFLCSALFLYLHHLISQKEIPLQMSKIERFSYVDDDSTRVWHTKNVPELTIFSLYKKNGEYFVLADTLYRDYILLEGKKYLIDSLCLKKYDDYAISFEYSGVYCLSHNQCSYLLIIGSNAFQYGTFVQPLYLVFQKGKTDEEYHFLSSYYIENVEDNSDSIYNSVKIIYKKNKILLKGINLVESTDKTIKYEKCQRKLPKIEIKNQYLATILDSFVKNEKKQYYYTDSTAFLLYFNSTWVKAYGYHDITFRPCTDNVLNLTNPIVAYFIYDNHYWFVLGNSPDDMFEYSKQKIVAQIIYNGQCRILLRDRGKIIRIINSFSSSGRDISQWKYMYYYKEKKFLLQSKI